jgi:hypothetical protein
METDRQLEKKWMNRRCFGGGAFLLAGALLAACGANPDQGGQQPGSGAGATEPPEAAGVDEALALAKQVFESSDPTAAYAALSEADRLKIDAATLPHSLEVTSKEIDPSNIHPEGAVSPGESAWSGCWGLHQTFLRKALLGNTLYTYWQNTYVCVNGTVYSVWVDGAGGETSTPGWRIANPPTTSTLNVSWEGRGLARYFFVFGAGGWDLQHPSDCIQQLLNSNGHDHRSTRSCDLWNP